MKSITHVDRKVKRERIKSTIDVFMKIFPDKGIKIIDIGTRTGYAVKLLKDAGYEVIGTDIEPYYVNYANEQGLEVIVDDFMDSQLPDSTFDLIYSRHVLEHCKDTEKFLKTCEKILKPTGKMFITFPTQKKSTFKKKDGKDGHLVCYETIEEFKEILKKTNINVAHLDYSDKVGIIPTKKELLLIATMGNAVDDIKTKIELLKRKKTTKAFIVKPKKHKKERNKRNRTLFSKKEVNTDINKINAKIVSIQLKLRLRQRKKRK